MRTAEERTFGRVEDDPFALDSLIKDADECHLMEKRFLPPRSQFEVW